jgi:hypothetical protein
MNCSTRCPLVSTPSSTLVEAGSNTSTVTLPVVGGGEKERLKSERVKYGRWSQGTQIRGRLRWQGPAACTKDRHIFRQRGRPTERRPKCKTVTPRLTDWMTVSRNMTLTFSQENSEVKSEVQKWSQRFRSKVGRRTRIRENTQSVWTLIIESTCDTDGK